MPMRIVLVVMTLLSAVSLAGAEMYQWVDESGAVTFSDFAPAPPDQPLPATRSPKGTPVPSSQSSTPKNERFTGTVEMYVTDWCGYCRKAESYMKAKGISYVAYDIEKDSSAKQRHKELGGRGVPLIIIGAHRMSGFSPESLEQYLNSSR